MPGVTIKPDHKAIDSYYKTLDELREGQDVHGEGNVRRAFASLLVDTARERKWTLIEELTQNTGTKQPIRLDGGLRDEWQLPHGYWEAKDSRDDLDTEIRRKRERGYPFDNIIFEDTREAVLFQDGLEVTRVPVRDRGRLADLLTRFYNHEIEPFQKFDEAINYFKGEIPNIANGLKARIEAAHRDNTRFQKAFAAFMELCRTALNPNISQAAVDEMLIQHMLTERIIRKVFDVETFTRRNVIAGEVEKVIDALTGQHFNLSEFLGALDRFYTAIEDAADKLANFTDKQRFINTVYERFFQGYSVRIADTHGIVYTPQEIVDFMCAAVEEVLADEFGKKLGDEDVYIIDPCTGTGSFIVNLIRRAYTANPRNFDRFYREQLFANEVMLMPYYIASLNIEHTYHELARHYEVFEGVCFVDTLDLAQGEQMKLAFMNEANSARVERQKNAPITVIIGNPPYNSKQLDENDNNKNRKYEVIDKRLAQTYGKDSNASLNAKLYDPYVKFFRWAADRLQGRDGIVCYVTNNSFVDQIAFDGMRKHLLHDFTRVYHLDLHGNVRQNPKLSGTTHNVFGIQVGVGVTVAIRSSKHNGDPVGALHVTPLQQSQSTTPARLFYHRVPEFWTRKEKLDWLAENVVLQGRQNSLNTVPWAELTPDSRHTWLVLDNAAEFTSFIPMGSKETKITRLENVETIFKTYSLGVNTARDNYVRSYDYQNLAQRIERFSQDYNLEVDRYKRNGKGKDIDSFLDNSKVKWSETLKRHLLSGKYSEFEVNKIRLSLYRPFCKHSLYYDEILNDRPGLFRKVFPTPASEKENRIICATGVGAERPFATTITNSIPDLNFYGPGTVPQWFPFYIYDEDGTNRRENITDWALAQFRSRYAPVGTRLSASAAPNTSEGEGNSRQITKWDIFYYVYALLHHPEYRTRYADNLKRELPRIPFVPDPSPNSGRGEGEGFWHFADAGRKLADLHLNYETVKPYELQWQVKGQLSYRVEKMKLKNLLPSPLDGEGSEVRTYKTYAAIEINPTLTLSGIPPEAFAYRLGNRSALEWVIDQYQVSTDARSGITSDPNRYSQNKRYIVDLVERIVRVSVETVAIVDSLPPLGLGE
jgi:predicted helicase